MPVQPQEVVDDADLDDVLTKHGAYVTDHEIAFLTKVADCNVEENPQTGAGNTGDINRISNRRHTNTRRNNNNNNSNTNKSHRRKNTTFDALFLISSAAQNAVTRRALRHIYADVRSTRPYRVKVVFLVGVPENSMIQKALTRESKANGDILLGNFVEHYFNLTYKTVMGYRWAQLHCRGVTLVLKIDDDVFVDVFKLFDYFLPIIHLRQRTIYGYVNSRSRVHRSGKFRVRREEFQEEMYPPFVNGFFAVLTRDVLDEVVDVAQTVKFFRLEDVFTYALVRRLMVDVQLVHLDVITHSRAADFADQRYINCLDLYKYRCKYMAAEVPREKLLEYHRRAAEYRWKLGLVDGV